MSSYKEPVSIGFGFGLETAAETDSKSFVTETDTKIKSSKPIPIQNIFAIETVFFNRNRYTETENR